MQIKRVNFEDIPAGQYRIIRTDGTEEVVYEKPTLQRMYEVVGNDILDSVVLTKGESGEALTCMTVDDTGLLDGKPLNVKATAIYFAMRGLTPTGIHGDVALVNDTDF